ncbi:MAG: Slp family lipoprotein [Betaproteobacteria bacterium]
MKNIVIILSAALLLTGCAPVLSRELMKQGERNVSLDQLRAMPDDYKGRLFILGGVIVDTRLSEQGSQIEALYVPVDSYGYLREGGYVQSRFLAIYPKSKGLLDPVVYKKGREITLAGEFLEMKKGKIDEMEYSYPVFEIRQIYLWEEERYYYYPPYYYYPYYPYYYNSPFLYDPWGRPWPYPYWP